MAYKGIIKGNTIEIEDTLGLPEGTAVEVEIKESSLRGSPQAILQHWEITLACTEEDVDALMKEIEKGKKEVRFEGVFDEEPQAS